MKKDLNIFLAYKSSSGRAGNSARLPILVVVFFLVLVGAAYGALFALEAKAKSDTQAIERGLSDPKLVEEILALETAQNTNTYLLTYRNGIKTASERLEAYRVLNRDLMGNISKSMPADVRIVSMSVSPLTAQLACNAYDPLSAARLYDALEKTGMFSSLSYDGVVAEDGIYSFSITCNFGKKAR